MQSSQTFRSADLIRFDEVLQGNDQIGNETTHQILLQKQWGQSIKMCLNWRLKKKAQVFKSEHFLKCIFILSVIIFKHPGLVLVKRFLRGSVTAYQLRRANVCSDGSQG